MKWRFFSPKKHVKFGRMIKRNLFKVCSIASYTFFPSFGQFVDTTPVKIFPFCEPFIEPFFHIFVRTKALLSVHVRDPSMQTSSNRKEPSVVSKPHGIELPSWVLPTCPELVLPYVMEHCHGENDLVLPLLVFWSFFKQRTVQIDQLLLIAFRISVSPDFNSS